MGAGRAGTDVEGKTAGRMAVHMAVVVGNVLDSVDVRRLETADCRIAVGHKRVADSSVDKEVVSLGLATCCWALAAADSWVDKAVESGQFRDM